MDCDVHGLVNVVFLDLESLYVAVIGTRRIESNAILRILKRDLRDFPGDTSWSPFGKD